MFIRLSYRKTVKVHSYSLLRNIKENSIKQLLDRVTYTADLKSIGIVNGHTPITRSLVPW